MDWERLKPTNLFEGASWHGRDIGSNGVGTCLAIAEPVILIGPEHFQEGYVGWTCIGAPIRDASRTVVGALGFSIPNEHAHVHAWGWALSVAQGVEANLQRDEPTNAHEIRRIAKGVVEAHGGHIWVESEERVGTTFFFSLPVSEHA